MTIDIQSITANLPDFLRPIDLVTCGLYKSRSDVCWAMKRGQAPPSIRLTSHKIVFPKASLCDWLREKAHLAGEVASVKH
jgi:predicted DNA-binding transcriptional regulator AlpA